MESNIPGFHFLIHRQNVLAKKSSIDFCTSKVPWVSSAANHDNKAGAVLVLFPFGTFLVSFFRTFGYFYYFPFPPQPIRITRVGGWGWLSRPIKSWTNKSLQSDGALWSPLGKLFRISFHKSGQEKRGQAEEIRR